MEKLKKMRAPLRAHFTRAHSELSSELAKEVPDSKLLKQLLARLEKRFEDLCKVDSEILHILASDDTVESADYEKEVDTVTEYENKFIDIRVLVDECLQPPIVHIEDDNKSLASASALASSTLQTTPQRFKLPKLEIQKFSGELKDWLCFWSLFKKIHEDESLDSEDKFQYLVQAIVPGSRARELVEGYPPTAENYPKVVTSLKSRFGREDLLVEVYVRELLALVLHNAINPREKVTLSKLFDKLECHMRALETLGVTNEKCASMLYPLVESSLPEETLKAWQRSDCLSSGSVTPKDRLLKLMDFLRAEVEGEERLALAMAGFGVGRNSKTPKKKESHEDVPTAAGLFNGNAPPKKNKNCVFCEKKHQSTDCFTAQKMTLSEKRDILMKRRCCFVCLKAGHLSKDCKTSVKCVMCTRKHPAIMCPDLPTNKVKSPEKQQGEGGASSFTHGMANLSCSKEVCMQTLMIKVHGQGKLLNVRAIIDTASQRSYILKKTAAAAGLAPMGKESIVHALFGGGQSSSQELNVYEVSVSNVENDFTCSLSLLDQTKICHDIPRIRKGNWFGELRKNGIWVTDVGSNSAEIEVLLGADVAGKLLTGNVRQLKSGLTAVETKLGWTLMGKIVNSDSSPSSAACLLVTTLLSGQSSIADLWTLDSLGIKDSGESKSRELMEQAARDHFLKTVKVNEQGRYEVRLPWVEGHPVLPCNRSIAEKRLLSASTKLVTDGRYEDYQNVFNQWLSEGIIEVVPSVDNASRVHYVPHRVVVKESSTTTKIRPVFDASAKAKGSPSLNDCLEKGPNLIEEIPATVIKFRLRRIGVISDIKQAFLQVAVNEKDCDYLRFLWWEDFNKKRMVVYRHRRAVFGATCSPFLLAAVLHLHLSNVCPERRLTAEQLLESFYVDNCVTSVSNEEELKRFMKESTEIMALGKFDLRGWEHTWLSNRSGKEEVSPLLGMLWNKRKDTLSCDMRNLSQLEGIVTKRKILSVAHKVFDIIGFTCPAMLYPKVLLQKTWKLKLGWDSELPAELSSGFEKWTRSLHQLSVIEVPRWFEGGDPQKENWSLHTFSDASKSAYAACVFLRIETELGVNVHLVQAKSRVAPLEDLKIPRLELMSCLIGCRLTQSVKRGLKLAEISTYYWNDSATALCWIQTEGPWATFVENRVREIRGITQVEDWRHVPGNLNPADLPSRGCSVKQLIESAWWEGPSWLKLPAGEWPVSKVRWDEDEVNSEKKKTVTSLMTTANMSVRYCHRFSHYSQIVNMVAWICRFGYNLRKAADKVSGTLNVSELDAAERKLLMVVQKESFSSITDKSLKSLSLFLDEHGLIRLKSRIALRDDNQGFKYPIVLPSHHCIVKRLIREQHLRYSHAGVQTLLTMLRERFWILKGRQTVSSVVRACQRCRRYSAKNMTSAPVALPLDRVRDAGVFEITGVDLAGPLFLKGGQKSWIVLFTCAVYRAVHFELITSLSTDAFLKAFRRFVSRRTRPTTVFSDNGTNFVGADNLFARLDWDAIEKYSTVRRIQWKFNPPTAAWWGGWWERIVRIIKNILRRVLGRSSLNYEDLSTVLCDGEAIINNRPLTYVSEDPEDLLPLTPATFLNERREDGVADIDEVDHQSLNRVSRHRQQLMQHFRTRFRSEYLSQLVERLGSKEQPQPVDVGDIVLMGSDNVKRLDWPLAKVVEVFPGKDGSVRVVKLKTASGEYVRPIQRVFPLEVSSTCDPVKEVEAVSKSESIPTEIPVKELRTKSGRVVKLPKKYCASFSSFIWM